jgi:hypothetical protein
VLFRVLGESGAHERIQNIMHVHLGQPILECLSCQVGLTTRRCVLARQQMMGVRIATGEKEERHQPHLMLQENKQLK